MAWKLTFDARQFVVKRLRGTATRLNSELATMMREEAGATEARVMVRLTGPRTAPGERKAKDAPLSSRSSFLRRSIGSRTTSQYGRVVSEVGVLKRNKALKYAAIHEFGGTIRPTKAKFLTIPLKASLTRSGVARWTARELMNGGGGKFTDTWIYRKDDGSDPLILGREMSGKIRALFKLVKSVRIPARPYLRPEQKVWFERVEKRGSIILKDASGLYKGDTRSE